MSPSQTGTDRIEKQIRLSVPRARVWRALTDPREFGQWFGVKLGGAVRYAEASLQQWMKGQQRTSTSG